MTASDGDRDVPEDGDLLRAEDRRAFLRKAGIAGAVVWAAPTLLSTAAHAQGTPLCEPNPVSNNQERQTVFTNGATANVLLPATNQAQLAAAMVPLDDATGATQVTISGGGWGAPIINKELSSPTGDRIALWVWARTTSLASLVTFTLSGAAAAPWRVLGIEYENVFAIGTAAAQGNTASTSITGPAVTIPNGSNGIAQWIGATRTDTTGFTPPSGYSFQTSEFQQAPNLSTGFVNYPGPTNVPAASTTIPSTADVVGAQIALLCTF